MSETRALTSQDLKAIGAKAARKAREVLFLGSVNVAKDFVKSGGWLYNLMGHVRFNPTWIKGNEMDPTQEEKRHIRWRREQTKVDQFRWVPEAEQKLKTLEAVNKKWLQIPGTKRGDEGIQAFAIDAAYACHNKLGNCREMAAVAAYYLSQYFMTPELKELVKNQQIQIAIVRHPTIEHQFVKMVANVQGADGKMKEETIFIDPWMDLDASFTLDEFEYYKKKIGEKLLHEEIAIINRTTPSVAAAKAEIEEKQKHYNDNMPNFTPNSFITLLKTDSTLMFSHYVHAFDTKLTELNIGERAAFFANEVLSAIKAGSSQRVAAYIDNVPILSTEILEAAAKSDNLEIATSIEKKLLERSKYYLGDIALVDLDKLEKNTICIVKEKEKFVWLEKDSNNNIIHHPIEYQKDGIIINGIHIPFNQFKEFDNALFTASQYQIVDIGTAQAMIAWHEHLSALRDDAQEAKQDLLLYALEKADLYAAEKIVANTGIRQSIEEKALNLEATNSQGQSSLFLAIKQQFTSIASGLINRKADLTQEDKTGISPFMLAAIHNSTVIGDMLERNPEIVHLTASKHENRTPLHFAVEFKAFAAMEALLDYNIKIDAIDDQGRTPLHYAVSANDVNAVKLLLERKADLSMQDATGKSALDYSKNPEITALLQHQITPDLESSPPKPSYEAIITARPPAPVPVFAEKKILTLHDAVRTGEMSVFEEKLQHTTDLESLDDQGKTPLCYALANRSFAMAKELIIRGARLDFIDDEESTYLHMAAKSGLVNLFFDYFKNDIDIQDINKRTALHLCVANRQAGDAETLLILGADPNIQDIEGKTAAHIAMQYADDETLLTLLSKPNVRLDMLDNMGRTPFAYLDIKYVFNLALKFGRDDVLNNILQYRSSERLPVDKLLCELIREQNEEGALLLIKHGVTGQTIPSGNFTPLELAIQTGQPNIIKALLQKGAKYTNSQPVNWLMSPETQKFKYHEVVNTLLESKITLSQLDADGCSLLHYAACTNAIKVIQLLGKHQAFLLNQADNRGNTPIHLAIFMSSKPETIDSLISLRVDLNIKNKQGMTPLRLALEKNQGRTACRLMMHGAEVEELKTGPIPLLRAELVAEAKACLSTISDDETRLKFVRNFLTCESQIRSLFPDKEQVIPELLEWHQELERIAQPRPQ